MTRPGFTTYSRFSRQLINMSSNYSFQFTLILLRILLACQLVTTNKLENDVYFSAQSINSPTDLEIVSLGKSDNGGRLLRKRREANPVLFHQGNNNHNNDDEDDDEDEDSGEDGGPKLTNDTIWWTNASQTIEIDYRYYAVNLYSPDTNKFKDYWIDIPGLLQNSTRNVKGETQHKQLSNSYRRAVSQKLSFKFPFYGHETENITIATGGFVYVGEHVHSWLAATQYIAPLMANFDTTTSENSNILYADAGDYFVVEWNQVVLRHQAEVGNFTFQVSLHKNGDIWFAYKDIPIDVKFVSDLHHPRKVGLSDAYLFTHNILTLSRRVIYEYHRVEVNLDFVKSGAVVEMKAQPVCIMLKDCKSCISANLTSFNCTWCGANGIASTADQLNTPFCSDHEGLNRKRQEYLDAQCNKDPGHVYCSTEESSVPSAVTEEITQLINSTVIIPPTEFSSPVSSGPQSTERTIAEVKQPGTHGNGSSLGAGVSMKKIETNGASAGGVVTMFILLAVIFTAVGWIVYAYQNPQTPSGQFLIRHRPSRWRWPVSHGDVHYTATVHM